MAEQERRSRVHYVHRMRYSAQERLVGVFVLVALAVLVSLILAKGRTSHLFEERVSYAAILRTAQGISTESAVQISGIEVGRVSSIDITSDNRIRVAFFVYEGFQTLLRQDSRGALSKLSLVGNAVIVISAGSPELPVLAGGSLIPIEEPMTMDQLLAKLEPVIERVNKSFTALSEIIDAVEPDQLRATSDDLAKTMANIRDVTEQINTGGGVLGRAVHDEEMAQQVSRSVASLEGILDEAEQSMKALKPLIGNMNDLSGETRELIAEMREAMHTINMELQQVPEMVNRMQLLLESTDRTLEGIRRVWPISSAIDPGTGATVIEERPVDE